MLGRPKNAQNKKYFVLLSDLNKLFAPETNIPITKDWALTIAQINSKLITTNNSKINEIKPVEKIQFEII